MSELDITARYQLTDGDDGAREETEWLEASGLLKMRIAVVDYVC